MGPPPSPWGRRRGLPLTCRQLPDYCLLVVVCPDGEANTTASHYTLQNLRPGTAYRVGVWEVTAETGGTCRPWWHFQTKALGNGLETPSPTRSLWGALCGVLTLVPKQLPCPTRGAGDRNATTQPCPSPGPQGAAWRSNLKYLGISLTLPAVATIYQLSKKR